MTAPAHRQPVALLSVYDKTGIVEFARELIRLGFRLLSSGGTAAALREADVPVTDVAEITGQEPVLGHRVVTLAPQIHGGLLALPTEDHLAELEQMGAPWIDLVCCDFYPLEAVIAKPDATVESVIEATDIGGPTMVRSAVKGRRIVICDASDRLRVLTWLIAGKPEERLFIAELCAKAEGMVADYCLTSARYQSMGGIDGMVGMQMVQLCYGENRSQQAAFYGVEDHPLGLHRFQRVAGTEPSYINATDVDRLARTMLNIVVGAEENGQEWTYVAIAVKHGNACGVGLGKTPEMALRRMIDGDRMAIFGGCVMTDFPITAELAHLLRTHGMEGERPRMLDLVAAPEFGPGADEVLNRKHGKCRMLANPALDQLTHGMMPRVQYRPTFGGFLRQEGAPYILFLDDERMQRTGELTSAQRGDLLLAWAIGSTSVSNTVTIVKDGMLVGNGVGQQARVRASRLALSIAAESGRDVHGAVAYSDSFFPDPDGLIVLAEAGVKAVFASSGSIRDVDVQAAARERGVVLWQLPDQVCRGFFGH